MENEYFGEKAEEEEFDPRKYVRNSAEEDLILERAENVSAR